MNSPDLPPGQPPSLPAGIPGANIPPPPQKSSSSTPLLIAAIGCGVVIVGIGIISLLAAIAVPAFMKARERALLVRSQMQARMIVIASKSYADDHNGEYPESLSVLVPDYVSSANQLVDPLPVKSGGTTVTREFIYYRPSKSDPNEMVVITSAGRTSSGERAVVKLSGESVITKGDPPGGP